jgi:RNA-directed DNA polymerase
MKPPSRRLQTALPRRLLRCIWSPLVEPHFHSDSYGYRLKKSALQAVGVTRERCWHFDWIIDLDIRGFLDRTSYCPQVHEMTWKRLG